MRHIRLWLALAVVAAAWVQSEQAEPLHVPTAYRTRANAIVCGTPFQIRKAVVAAAQDDGARIRELACSRPGAGRRAHLVSAPVTRYGPWEIRLVSEEGLAEPLWGYADQFEPDLE